jgi:hypothetical protein
MRRDEAIALLAKLLAGAPNGLLSEEIASATSVASPSKTISVMRDKGYEIENKSVFILLPDGATQLRDRYVLKSLPKPATSPEEFRLE